jgi:hydroxypyruvate reductase
MITDMNANRFVTHSLNDPRILRIFSAALEAVDPYKAVQKYLPKLSGRVYGLAIGKASIPMLTALAEAIPLSDALAISKHASIPTPNLFPVFLGSHPIPDSRSLEAGQRVLDFVSALEEEDTLVCLISGGGSALVTAPYEGITLEDMQALTSLMLACGARIDEINTLRRHLDRVKGGGLARATRAKVISLILSDVIGNPLEAIASGPTVPNPTTNDDALKFLKKYKLQKQVAKSIIKILESDNLLSDTEKLASQPQSQNIIIGDNRLAAQAAVDQAQREGIHTEILTNELQGEAREAGRDLAHRLRVSTEQIARPFCLIAGGETTVTIRGNGKGGRSQELALAAVDELSGLENVFLIALATDGDDGPTDAAGAVATGKSAQRAESLGVDVADHLSRNDAYVFFDKLDDLLKTGPSGTNVNDLIFLIALD